MGIMTVSPRAWNISKKDLNTFDREGIENILGSFNRTSGGSYYMLDYCEKKLFVDAFSPTVLCGYSKDLADSEGFNFFKRTQDPKDQSWLDKVNVKAFRFFFNYPEKKRRNLVVSYDLTVQKMDGSICVLHHKNTPFRLCRNGNVWLGLCHVTEGAFSVSKNRKASIFDATDNKRYDFVNGEFMLSDVVFLTDVEKQILRLMAKDLTADRISQDLDISVPTLNRYKRKIFDKLGVNKSTSAIHKAFGEGLI